MLILPINNVVSVSDAEDDCNCKPVSNLHLVILERLSNKLDRLLGRLDVYIGIISILYRHNPDVTERFEELSNRITSLRESNDALESVFEFSWEDILCDIIEPIILPLEEFMHYLNSLMNEYPLLELIILPFYLVVEFSVYIPLWVLYYVTLECPWRVLY
jgi:hypothetical protein